MLNVYRFHTQPTTLDGYSKRIKDFKKNWGQYFATMITSIIDNVNTAAEDDGIEDWETITAHFKLKDGTKLEVYNTSTGHQQLVGYLKLDNMQVSCYLTGSIYHKNDEAHTVIYDPTDEERELESQLLEYVLELFAE